MENDVFEPTHLKTTVLDLLKDDRRDLAWSLIDHYYAKSSTIAHFDVVGYIALKAEKRDTYLKCAEAAYALASTPEQLYLARVNLYKAYNTMNYPEKALFYIEQNLKVVPDDLDTLCHKAFNVSLMGNKQEADRFFEEIINQRPVPADFEKTVAAANGGKHLREGRTAQGILAFVEAFKPTNSLFETRLKMKRWKGVIKPGKTLYVDMEGGLGDQIINIRFFDRIKSYGMNPVLVSQNTKYYNDINALFIRHGYNVLTDHILIDRTEQWVPMMSIPGYLGLREDQLWSGPYLTPLRNPRNTLPPSTRPRIGIKCSGNPYFGQDEYRKIPFEQLKAILPQDADIYYIDSKVEYEGVINCSKLISSWEDTLDIIDQMDCIVSSCTSLVHAAGALGKTTFVAVPIAEYYIWSSSRTDGSSPWYGDNFYVAKQTQLRDWSQPLGDIQQRVHTLLKDRL